MRTKHEQDGGDLIQGPWSRPASAPDKAELECLAKETADQIVAGSGVRYRRLVARLRGRR